MLTPDPDRLIEEIQAQDKARDEHLEGTFALIEKYPGSWYTMAPGPEAAFDSENAAFEVISHFMSLLVWENPRWRGSTARPRAQEMVAEAIQHGMNRWTVDTNLKTTLEDQAVDYMFGYSITHVTPRPRVETYEAEDPAMWPQWSRISPMDFSFDHRAPTFRRARMASHQYRIDKSDLMDMARFDRERPRSEREGWDMNAIRELNEAPDNKSRSRAWASGVYSSDPDREQVIIREVYLPTYQLSNKPGPRDGFHGTIVTLGTDPDGESGVMVRPPRPFYGPRWGMYTLIGCYTVPDSPFPLSPLVANAGHIEQASRISRAVDAQVEAYKRLLISQDPTLAAQIKNGKSDHVYYSRLAREINQIVQEKEFGGTTPGNVAAEVRAVEKRDRALGMDDVQKGNVTGAGTAREVTLAVNASEARQGYIKARFQDGVRRAGRTVAWYLYHMDEITFPLGNEVLEAMGIQDPEIEPFFEGGRLDEGSGATFDDIGLELEPYSMERQSSQLLQARGDLLLNMIQLYPQIAQLGQMGADVKGLMDAIGDSFSFPKLSRLFPGIEDVDLSQIQPFQASPRLSRDIGKAGLMRHLSGGQGLGGSGSAPGAPAGARAPQGGPVGQSGPGALRGA